MNVSTIRLSAWLPILLLSALCHVSRAEPVKMAYRIGVTPAIVHDQYGLLEDWQHYLEKKLQRPVRFVSRDSYRETIDLLKSRELDFAWVSDYPFVYLYEHRIARLLAVP